MYMKIICDVISITWKLHGKGKWEEQQNTKYGKEYEGLEQPVFHDINLCPQEQRYQASWLLSIHLTFHVLQSKFMEVVYESMRLSTLVLRKEMPEPILLLSWVSFFVSFQEHSSWFLGTRYRYSTTFTVYSGHWP